MRGYDYFGFVKMLDKKHEHRGIAQKLHLDRFETKT